MRAVRAMAGALLFLSAVRAAGNVTFSPTDADATLESRRLGSVEWVSDGFLAVGDFDGDGRGDVALTRISGTSGEVVVFLGGRWSGVRALEESAAFRVVLPTGTNARPSFADLNGDGRKDLVLSGGAKVWVFWGRAAPGGTVDLNAATADLEVSLPSPCGDVASGDVNGDGREDLLLGMRNGRGRVALVWGRSSFPAAIDAANAAYATTFLGDSREDGMLGSSLVVADVNGDGYADVFLSAFNTYLAGNHRGRIYGFFGSSSPGWGTWDLTTATVPVVLSGTYGVYYGGTAGAGDFDGDGRADLVIYTYNYAKMVWLSGQELTPGASLYITSSPPYHRLEYHYLPCTGDFDGDGRADLFANIQNASGGVGWLSTGGDGGAHPATPRLSFNDGAQAEAVGDLDGDGRADVLRYGVFTAGSEQVGRLSVYYGFRPFWNPTVNVRSRPEDAARLRLDLAPDGDAAAMRIEGDVRGEGTGAWVPFQTPVEVESTPALGTKTLSVTFREAGGRQSVPVARTFDLRASDVSLRTLRNRIHPGEEAAWEVVTPGGRLSATIYDADGRRVRVLASDERAAGVWTLRWDGRNAARERAAPGVYVLGVSIGGTQRRDRVLVTP